MKRVVSIGVDHDTAEFAVATLDRWWREMGHKAYPRAKKLLVTADGGGSNVRVLTSGASNSCALRTTPAST